MPSGLLSRSRLLSGCAVLLSAGVIGGCATTTPAVTVTGRTLTIYLSAPSSLSGDPQSQDVIDAEKLAFNEQSGQVHGFTLKLQVVSSSKVSDNARTAIEDKNMAVAYLGEVQPGTSIDSLGITNAEDLLQVSPTQAPPVPTSDFESFSTYGRTFASLAPASDQQAQTILGTAGGKAFAHDFRTSYGHAPASQAIFGYVAMAAVLKALQKAGPAATNRGTIVTDFFALKDVQLLAGSGGPELCTYTVNKRGTVTITPASGS